MEENKIVNKNLIFLDVDLENKKDVISYIANEARELGYIEDIETFVDSVMEREKEVPTAIGYNIAIPHGKTDVVRNPFIAFLRSKNKFKWTEGFEEEVQLIFQIGVPETGTEKLHLKFISEVSKKLLDEDFRKKLLLIKNHNQLFDVLNSIKV